MSSAAPSPQPLRVFVVEDNTIIRQNLVATLEELAGITSAGWAATEHAAIDWLERDDTDWDLMTVDLMLAQGTGTQVVKASVDRRPDQKVVVLSNYTTPDLNARCRDLGVDAVFDKSTGIDALLDYCTQMQAERSASHR